jgi:hypothetical protein
MDETTQVNEGAKIAKVLAGWLPEHTSLNEKVDELEQLAIRGEAEAVVKALCEMVPTFRPLASAIFKPASKVQNGSSLPHSLPSTIYST